MKDKYVVKKNWPVQNGLSGAIGIAQIIILVKEQDNDGGQPHYYLTGKYTQAKGFQGMKKKCQPHKAGVHVYLRI